MVVAVGHCRELTPAMRQKRNQKQYQTTYGKSSSLCVGGRRERVSWTLGRTCQGQGKKEDGTQAQDGADIHGHLPMLGKPQAQAPGAGKTARLGTHLLGADQASALADDVDIPQQGHRLSEAKAVATTTSNATHQPCNKKGHTTYCRRRRYQTQACTRGHATNK